MAHQDRQRQEGKVACLLEVLRFHFLVDPDPEPESHPKEPELESLGSGSVLESDPP